VRAELIALRALAADRGRWVGSRDLVFRHAELHSLDVLAFVRDVFTRLAPGLSLTEQPEERAFLTERGDGILATDRWYDLIHKELDVFHVVVNDEVAFRAGIDREIAPEVVVELSATEALDVATDAILLCATTAGMELVRRDDTPTKPSCWILPPTAAAMQALERIDSRESVGVRFARVIINLFPQWFDFDPTWFHITHAGGEAELVVTTPHSGSRIVIQTGSSRNIACDVHTRGGMEHGLLSMHYRPSIEQLERARRTLAFAMYRLFPEHALHEELARILLEDAVFPAAHKDG